MNPELTTAHDPPSPNADPNQKNEEHEEHESPVSPTQKPHRKRSRRILAAIFLMSCITTLGILAYREYKTSALQADYFLEEAKLLTFRSEKATVEAPIAPAATRRLTSPQGPRDQRLGYTQAGEMLATLEAKKRFALTMSAIPSQALLDYTVEGFYPPYEEKLDAGLTLSDRRDAPLVHERFPRHIYPSYEAIPPLALETIFFLENREMAGGKPPTYNYVLEWDRTIRSFWMLATAKLTGESVHGGSTLSTQWEKFSHTSGGRTEGMTDKLIQIYSASIRLYGLSGSDTELGRRRIALYYINQFPLGARPDLGEVHGLRDGFFAWYGLDPDEVDAALRGERDIEAQGHALRHTMALFIGLRRPSSLLAKPSERLPVMIDEALGSMREQEIISAELHARALAAKLEPIRHAMKPAQTPDEIVRTKVISSFRAALAESLGVKSQYDLERMDLSARATLDNEAQREVEELLITKMRDPEFLQQNSFLREYGLRDGAPADVHYSFILLEREEQQNKVRLEVDTLERPFNFNRGARVDLGSTSKLRTLVTYLELVASLYDTWRPLTKQQLVALEIHPRDRIASWVQHELYHNRKMTKKAIIEQALEYKYAASPARFMTGGGIHVFHNFNKDYNTWKPNLKLATRQSINLVFIRLMQDLVWHYRWAEVDPTIISDQSHPRRREYLEKWVAQDALAHLEKYHARYRKLQGADELLAALIATYRNALTPSDYVAIYTYLYPDWTVDEIQARVEVEIAPKQRPTLKKLKPSDWDALHARSQVDVLGLQDRAYIAELHPIELWLVRELMRAPQQADRTLEALQASMERDVRPEIYAWLTDSKRKRNQDNKIYTMLEQDAFRAIQREWARMGYPFEDLVPSLATALGASGDRPESLSKLMGIIMARGKKYPVSRLESIEFAVGTPYAFGVQARPDEGVPVLHEEVAEALQEVLGLVVQRGTAVRARPLTTQPLFADLMGKTGTGDHTLKHMSASGHVIEGKAVSRAGVFMYGFGDRFFGVLTVYVEGEKAQDYTFTSSLTSQIFTHIAPTITKMVARQDALPTLVASSSEEERSIDLDLAPRKRKPMLKRVIDPVMGKLMKPTPEELEGSDGAHSGVVLTPLETGDMGNIPMDRPEELPPLE